MMDVDSPDIGGVPSVDGSARSLVDTSGGSQFSAELLQQYYQRLFPAQELFRWLSYGNDPDHAAEDATITADYFARREICFTLGKFVCLCDSGCCLGGGGGGGGGGGRGGGGGGLVFGVWWWGKRGGFGSHCTSHCTRPLWARTWDTGGQAGS